MRSEMLVHLFKNFHSLINFFILLLLIFFSCEQYLKFFGWSYFAVFFCDRI